MPSPRSTSISTSTHHSKTSSQISLCLSTHYTNSTSFSESDSDRPPHPGVPPNILIPKPVFLEPDKTIYSFVWTSSHFSEHSDKPHYASDHLRPEPFDEMSGASQDSKQVDKDGAKFTRARYGLPTLPSPFFWTSVTLPTIFRNYIKANNLLPLNRMLGLSEAREYPSEAVAKPYGNLATIARANTDLTKVNKNCPTNWISDHFRDSRLPVAFKEMELLQGKDLPIWKKSPKSISSSTFAKLPDTSNDAKTARWLNRVAEAMGKLHKMNTIDDSEKGCRVFSSEGSNLPLAGGLHERKPDIVLIDGEYRSGVPDSVRLNWAVVQAFVEVTSQENRSYNEIIQNVCSKAANIFHAQIHRKYVIAIVITGSRSRNTLSFYCVYIDRVGASSTVPLTFKGYGARDLARIIFALAHGKDELLGHDTSITIDRFNGNPLSVVVDGHTFTFITEIFDSPYLFSRGTRVFIVKDVNSKHHILKDSWIVATHNVSEIENLKIISARAQDDDVDPRLRALLPRFIAGDDNVDETSVNRGYLPVKHTHRQRRRIITGPIGDPITSYCSRVECLQAFVDIADRKYSIIFCDYNSLLNVSQILNFWTRNVIWCTLTSR